jgi:small-conductance mechanosensitive channel
MEVGSMFKEIFQDWGWFVAVAGTIGGALLLGLGIHYLIFKVGGRLAQKTQRILGNSLLKHCRSPSKVILPILVAYHLLPLVDVPPKYIGICERIFILLLIISVAWLVVNLTYVFEDIIVNQFKIDMEDTLKSKKIKTQIQVLRKVVVAVVAIIALAVILMSFEKVRYLGTSILASAGVIGIVVGVAAQRSIGTLLAGLQIAITEPISIDDVVIVENEWGWIEEINLTYVIVRIWDLRRLVLPITYFLEKPFQNWTRRSTDLLGTVLVYVDYTVAVQAVREELHHILENSKLWDGRTWGLQVTNATEHTVELRALMSAADSSNAWNLRCEVREKLIEFIQKNYPHSLPKVRAEVSELARK